MARYNTLRFVNDDGRCFSIRILRKKDYYGDDESLTYQEDEPSLEFFDATGFDLQEEREILGYFTGIRCEISALFVHTISLDSPINEHLWIWNISEKNIQHIKDWLLTQLNEQEKQFIDLNQVNHTRIPRPPDEDSLLDTQIASSLEEITMITEEEVVHSAETSPTISQSVNSISLQQLQLAIQALDLAEQAEEQWQQGQVQVRLHILAAKKNILRAIALLTHSLL